MAGDGLRWLVGPRLQRRFGVWINFTARILLQASPENFAAQVHAILDVPDDLRLELHTIDGADAHHHGHAGHCSHRSATRRRCTSSSPAPALRAAGCGAQPDGRDAERVQQGGAGVPRAGVRSGADVRRPAAALLGLALLLGACSSSDGDETLVPTSITRPAPPMAPITTVPGAPPLAVVLGDSNTFLSGREINKQLAAKGLTPDVRGISGSGVRDDLRDWFPAAEAIGRGRPSVVVVALGTNDAVAPEDAQAFAERGRAAAPGARRRPGRLGDAHRELGARVTLRTSS